MAAAIQVVVAGKIDAEPGTRGSRRNCGSRSRGKIAAKQFMPVVAQGLFRTLGLEVDLAEKLKNLEIAESAIQQMKQNLDEHPENRAHQEHWYLADAADVANPQGHKLDALLYYSKAFSESPEDSSSEAHARELWKELGVPAKASRFGPPPSPNRAVRL